MSATLSDILAVLENPVLSGDASVPIYGVSHDSRKIEPGWAFVALRGEFTDGHNFVGEAVRRGAVAIIAETERPSQDIEAAWVTVDHTRRALGPVAGVIYGRPTTELCLVGITGTNGKTTITFLLEAILRAAGASPGVAGTITYRWGGQERPAPHTTPEASDLQALFREMVDAGVTHAIIEVSSHGLHQGRLDGCHFDVGLFTNLTQDHLDYHGTMEEYFLAKQILFNKMLPSSWKTRPAAVINLDDPFGQRLAVEIVDVQVLGFGTTVDCSVRPESVTLSADGIAGNIITPSGVTPVRSLLTGSFNLSNILAAIAVSEVLGIPSQAIAEGIETIVSVPGRLERVSVHGANVFVDYAHTPNALKNVLAALQDVSAGKIITIMGCGGDRDKTKRPVMGMEAAAGSDFVIITSDNPRSENPMDIIRQVEEGVRGYGFTPLPAIRTEPPLPTGYFLVLPDRREAIAWALSHLEKTDMLLVAGKGHETYQEVNGIRYPFDDRKVVEEELEKLSVSCSEHAAGALEATCQDPVSNCAGGRP